MINFGAIPKIQNTHGFNTSTNMALHKNLCKGKKLVMNKAVKSQFSEDTLSELQLFSLQKAPGRPNCILKGVYKKSWSGTFTWVCSDRTRGNGFKMKDCRFTLESMKYPGYTFTKGATFLLPFK